MIGANSGFLMSNIHRPIRKFLPYERDLTEYVADFMYTRWTLILVERAWYISKSCNPIG